jgi:uroporphyrinogen-III synthase
VQQCILKANAIWGAILEISLPENDAPILLLTRPRAQAEAFAAEARARFGEDVPVLVSPILRITALPFEASISAQEALIFSSVHGVAALGAPALQAQRAYCVGDQTARAAAAAGYQAISAGKDARALIARIARDAPQVPLVYAHGAHRRVDIAAELRARGLNARAIAVYDQVAQPLSPQARDVLDGPAPVLLPLFSPRSAALLSKAAQNARAPLYLAPLSANVEAAWTGPAHATCVAAHPDAAHMLDALAQLLRDAM